MSAPAAPAADSLLLLSVHCNACKHPSLRQQQSIIHSSVMLGSHCVLSNVPVVIYPQAILSITPSFPLYLHAALSGCFLSHN